MSDHNEQLEPTPFELAPADEQTTQSEHRGGPRWILPALAGLAILALLVFFWLPQQVSEPQDRGVNTDEAMSPSTPAAPQSPADALAEDASPWSEAQAARLRKEAQEVLQDLLDLQFTLEESAAERWAGEQWADAVSTAKAGDELYRQRRYVEAKEEYASGLQQMREVEARLPAAVEEQLEMARAALEAGQVQDVNSALELVTLIAPENAELADLRQRADSLPSLIKNLQEATAAEARGELNEAEESLRQAVALDPQHQRAASELERVSIANTEQRFNAAMSSGYLALDEQDFTEASAQFSSAQSLKPNSAEASSALQELQVARQAAQLVAIKTQGAKLESNEQWQAAADAYQRAVKLDSSVLFASEGLKRSQARARLDQQFRKAIEQPERLADVAVADATASLLEQARKISPRGPVLAKQVNTLEQLLEQYNTLVPVNFRSDGETEVIVYKVARLGRFQETTLTLRPGSYRVRGSRRGYRDVLHTFTVSHEGDVPAITVTCTERIL